MPERAVKRSKLKASLERGKERAPTSPTQYPFETAHRRVYPSRLQGDNTHEDTTNAQKLRAHRLAQQKRQKRAAREQLSPIQHDNHARESYHAQDVGTTRPNRQLVQSRSASSDTIPLTNGGKRSGSQLHSGGESPLVTKNISPDPSLVAANSEATHSSTPSISNWSPQIRGGLERDLPDRECQQIPRLARRRLVDSLCAAEGSILKPVLVSASQIRGASTSTSTGNLGDPGILPSDLAQQRQASGPSLDNAWEAVKLTSSRTQRSRMTYARQRSFLGSSLDTTGPGLSHATATALEVVPTRRSPAPFKHPTLPTLSADAEEHDRPVRSIHELRQAGDNARFKESVEALLDDIEDSCNTISERCNGFVQLCSKLLEPDLMHRFSECDFGERLVRCTMSDIDIISMCLALCAYRLICLEGSNSKSHLGMFWTILVDKSPSLLSVQDDLISLARKPSSNISRAMQTSLRDLLPRLASSIFPDNSSPKLSPHLAVLSCIQFCLTEFRKKSQPIDLMSSSLIDKLIEALLPRNDEIATYPLSSVDFQSKTTILLILESYFMLSVTPGYNYSSPFRKFVLLHDGFVQPAHDEQRRQIQALYLRVILNLTNNEYLACEQYARPEMMTGFVRIVSFELSIASSDFAGFDDQKSFNLVILALGILINLAEQSEKCRASFLVPMDDSQLPLQILVQHFSIGFDLISHAKSILESQSNVAVGYLSILLAVLCLHKEVHIRIRELLLECGKEVASVISTAREFLLYHRKIESSSRLGEVHSTDNSSTARLARLIEQLGQP
ncbi:WAPL family protein [Aspergillus saccharolyticus JOP 1030-1]|uniref:Wings apart-like protein C-terminal domain-containing protein n=1 Tax=Aspergillus saccharolyticus JOP 1030-1 TaxID=1450539 RepID=A0A318YZR3_9EURO|nr:hypothetical protein BP01DRAFT_330410 [Aspergillus saccharolyticus JOP 1030-1]PYH40206.1 hypothetical protein BP01DRAFT_330410 [Aspergillus saccharolyticus JOP 1030-1]